MLDHRTNLQIDLAERAIRAGLPTDPIAVAHLIEREKEEQEVGAEEREIRAYEEGKNDLAKDLSQRTADLLESLETVQALTDEMAAILADPDGATDYVRDWLPQLDACLAEAKEQAEKLDSEVSP